jgi:RNA polymerase sigma factor (sigma-70 family)
MRIPVEVLIQEYQRNLFVAAFNICGNSEDAQDVVQDTFIQYHTSTKQFNGKQHIKAWLLRVAINRAKDKQRSFWHRKITTLEDYNETVVFDNDSEGELLEAVMSLPDDNMSNWSDITEVTAQEYATEKQLQIVNISGTITNDDELGIDSQSMDFYASDDDVMYIYVRCNKESSVKNFNVSWLATANIYSENIQFDDVVRSTITFTLEDISTLTQIEYLPNSSNPDMQCEIIKAEIVQTEIGTYVDIYYTDTQQISNDGLTFRLIDSNGEAYQSVGGSGIIYQEDGLCMERIIMNKTNLDDTIIVEAFNCYDKAIYGRTEMSIEQ